MRISQSKQLKADLWMTFRSSLQIAQKVPKLSYLLNLKRCSLKMPHRISKKKKKKGMKNLSAVCFKSDSVQK